MECGPARREIEGSVPLRFQLFDAFLKVSLLQSCLCRRSLSALWSASRCSSSSFTGLLTNWPSLGDASPDLSFTEFDRDIELRFEMKVEFRAKELDLVNPTRECLRAILRFLGNRLKSELVCFSVLSCWISCCIRVVSYTSLSVSTDSVSNTSSRALSCGTTSSLSYRPRCDISQAPGGVLSKDLRNSL